MNKVTHGAKIPKDRKTKAQRGNKYVDQKVPIKGGNKFIMSSSQWKYLKYI